MTNKLCFLTVQDNSNLIGGEIGENEEDDHT